MKDLLPSDKKAVSLMIGYVLLIVLAVGIAGAVYSFLKFYLPDTEIKECPNDVSLIISNASCDGELKIELHNKGFFSIDGAYVKAGAVGKVAKDTLCFTDQTGTGGTCNILFEGQALVGGDGSQTVKKSGLKPGEIVQPGFKSFTPKEEEIEIEIEPVIYVEDKLTACRNAIIKKVVTCGESS